MTLPEPEFIDDIVPDNAPVHSEPPARRDKFLPWHRVRKEYIRRFQWSKLTSRVIERSWKRQLQLDEGEWLLSDNDEAENSSQLTSNTVPDRALRCLVIPGEDLLDMRALWRDIQQFNCAIQYLGFNESQGSNQKGTRIHVSNNEVTSLQNMVKRSVVIQDRFEAIANENSQAYRYLKGYGPYHVVNLDLCGSIFPNTAKDSSQYYDALLRLLAYQFEHQKAEWLLFITTMVEPSAVNADGLQQLCRPTRENFEKHKDFAARISEILPPEAFQDASKPVDLNTLNENQMIQLFGVALGKWMLRLCHDAQPKWTIAMRRSYRYFANEDKGAVLLSLAFELRPNVSPPADATGVATLQLKSRKYPDEGECALKLAESVANIHDVEAELNANQALKAELRDAQATLLESAGYDRDAYVAWVNGGEVIGNE
jgi:hypothetical protein